jgi:hypothetical protein
VTIDAFDREMNATLSLKLEKGETLLILDGAADDREKSGGADLG